MNKAVCAIQRMFAAIGIFVVGAMLSLSVAWGQDVMQTEKKVALIEFLLVFRRAAEAGVFADPAKLNEMIPMQVEWHTPEEQAGSPWRSAKAISLNLSFLMSGQIQYMLREPSLWVFSIPHIDKIACLSFDEIIALWGTNYRVLPKLHRRYTPGTVVRQPGPEKMAGEGVSYRFMFLGLNRSISFRVSFEGCVESIGTGQSL